MEWKSRLRALLFPPLWLRLLLTPCSAAALVYAMANMEQTHPLRIGSYVLSFYALCLWCVQLPRAAAFFRTFRRSNRYARRFFGDVRLRVRLTLTANVIWNAAYAAMQLALCIYHRSLWFGSLAGYYCTLALMRLWLARHTARHEPGARMREELRRYRACGWTFLLTNLALSAMIFHMIYENRIVRHHEITTIAMAAYTFTTLTVAIVGAVRYRRYNSPVFSASKAISLASACVSMLTLEGTMLATFRTGEMTPAVQRLFLTLSGGAVSAFIVAMAIWMIVRANRNLKLVENEHG